MSRVSRVSRVSRAVPFAEACGGECRSLAYVKLGCLDGPKSGPHRGQQIQCWTQRARGIAGQDVLQAVRLPLRPEQPWQAHLTGVGVMCVAPAAKLPCPGSAVKVTGAGYSTIDMWARLKL